jgi:hypothetical protein
MCLVRLLSEVLGGLCGIDRGIDRPLIRPYRGAYQ